jgi:hypothetical protein
VLVMMALVTFLIGLLADLVGGVRRVQQELLYRVRTMQVEDEDWRRAVGQRLDTLEGALPRAEAVGAVERES